jgi:DNA polymerase elongation subunit (family B)
MKFYKNVDQVGDRILVRGWDGNKEVRLRDEFYPTLYVRSNNGEDTGYTTLEGDTVKPIRPGGIRDSREFCKRYENVENFTVYGNQAYLYQWISDNFPGEVKYDPSKIRVFTIDIETAAENGFPDIESADQEILLITVKDSFTGIYHVWGSRPFQTPQADVSYTHCANEQELLQRYLAWWTENYPDVITGWNVNLFDVPYICNRLARILGDKTTKLFSPWKLLSSREIYIQGRKNISYDVSGITVLDYLDLYKKFTYTNQESYRLDHIAFVELGRKKLDHSEFDTFKEFYTNDWKKFVEYNIIDVRLVDQLEDKMKLMDLAFTLAYDAKVNLEDVFSQVRMWDAIIYNYLRKRNIAIPPKQTSVKKDKYAGAYVKEPIAGIYEWVVNFDLNSLYPHLIMQYNISPETLMDVRHPSATVDGLLNKKIDIDGEYCVCANGAQYRKDVRGFLPELMEKIYDERSIYKRKMLDAKQEYEASPTLDVQKRISRYNNFQMARKIQLNSAYGAIGNEYFRYYKLANAEAITLSGQVSIRWIELKINQYLNKTLSTEGEDYVIASDTDSIYLNMGPLVTKFFSNKSSNKAAIVSILDKICQEKLEPFIERSYQELASYVSAYDQKMIMKRENIADRGIWTAKKRYILNVWNSEGVAYKEPKMKIMGLETARSSVPQFFRDRLKKAYRLIMSSDNDTVIEFIDKCKKETRQATVSEIAFPRGCNNLGTYSHPKNIYEKGCPIHVRGSLLYNYYIKKYGIENKHARIQEGEKIKFIYLKEPNILGENVISFFQELPQEFGLEQYIDFDKQFNKSFYEPLRSVLECIGWKPERSGSLLEFF